MKSFDATQIALRDATYKTLSWFFECSNVYIDYDAKPESSKFTVGNTVYGGTSGATATIEKHERFTQTTGRLHLSGILGTFEDDEVIYEATYGSELITNGTFDSDLTGWDEYTGIEFDTFEQAAGKLHIADDGGDRGLAGTAAANLFPLTDDRFYILVHTFAFTSGTIGNIKIVNGYHAGPYIPLDINNLSASETRTDVFQATYTGDHCYEIDSTAAVNVTIDGVSLKQITNAALVNGAQQGSVYYWSFKEYGSISDLTFGAVDLTFGTEDVVFGNDYDFKVIKESFNGITLTAPLSNYGIYAPNILDFEIANADDALTASDFVNSRVLLSLAFESDGTYRIMRQFKYVVDKANSVYHKINFHCKDFIAKNMEGDYPATPMASDLFSPLSSNSEVVDSEPFCVPIPFGTAYIPLQVVSDTAYNRGYLLGPDTYTYTVSEVSSPRYFNAAQTWESTDANFRQATKTDRLDPSQDWKVLYPFLAKMDSNSYAGTHTGANDAATLTDSTKAFTVDSLIGLRIVNDTDGSAGYITDNDATTVTATLSGGTQNDWDTGDVYHIEMTGLWVVNGEYQNLLVKLARSDLSSTTDPADHLEFVLEDMGIGSGNIDDTTTFAAASTTYSGWSLTFNGAYYYRQPRQKVIASILNQCHSTIDVDTKVELRVLSKTSQKTLTDANILKGTFNYNPLTKSEFDSGYIAFQESGKPQDIFQKIVVPAKNTWDNISSEVLPLPFVQDSQTAQKLGMLYYQRKLLGEARETFSTKSNCIDLQPNDVITINATDYGPSHDVVIESMTIKRDASISFNCVRHSLALDDFDDLSPAAITITDDGNVTYWQPVITGPDGLTPGTGTIPHVIPGKLRIGGSGDYILIDPTIKRISSSNYVSGAAGSGFSLDSDQFEVGNIACRGVIRTAVFQKDVVSVIGGNLLVRPGDVLATDMTALDASTLTIEGNETLAVNDILRIKDGTDDEWLLVTNTGSAPTYTVTRDVDAQYGADSNPAWKKGATVVNYGQSGDGGILLSSSETNAPYVSVFTHAGAPYDTLTTRLRLGNLNGYLGNATDLYGIGIGETGKSLQYDPTNGLVLTGPGIEVGTVGYFRSAGKTSYADTDAGIWVGYDSGAYKVYIGDASSYIKWDGSTLTITGGVAAASVEVGTSGYVRTTGKTSYADTDAGFWLGYDATAYKLNIGDASNYIKWDGSALTIVGTVSATSVEVGTSGYVRTAGKTAYTDDDAGVWLGYDSTAYKLYIGNATQNIKWSGAALTVTGDVIVTGNLVANAVTILTTAYTAAPVDILNASLVTIQTCTFTSTGAQVFISASCEVGHSSGITSCVIYLYRGATELVAFELADGSSIHENHIAFSYTDTPGSGSVSYYLKGQAAPTGGGESSSAYKRSLTTLEVKR